MDQVPYALSQNTWSSEEWQALQDCIKSGRFTMGPKVKEFEERFASSLGRRFGVMANSGSSANLLAIAALFYKKDEPLVAGDEVIVPAIAWATTYSPLAQLGLSIRVADIDLNTLNTDESRFEQLLTKKTRLIIGVSVLGNPAPLDKIQKLCQDNHLYFVEDNCESLGARVAGKPTGSFGHISTTSFFFAHHISTMEGGMLLTDDAELAAVARSLRSHGWARDAATSVIDAPAFPEAYQFLFPGYNLRPLELSAAVGITQLPRLEQSLRMRRTNAQYFREHFASDKRFILQREHGESSWYSFTMIASPESGYQRTQILERLRKAGIEFRMITGGNVARHPYAKHLRLHIPYPLKNADLAHDQGFFVGNASEDLRAPIDHLYKALKELA